MCMYIAGKYCSRSFVGHLPTNVFFLFINLDSLLNIYIYYVSSMFLCDFNIYVYWKYYIFINKQWREKIFWLKKINKFVSFFFFSRACGIDNIFIHVNVYILSRKSKKYINMTFMNASIIHIYLNVLKSWKEQKKKKIMKKNAKKTTSFIEMAKILQ